MTSKKVFKDADLVAMLAWLDYCGRNELDFWETVADHLAQARIHRSEEGYMFTKRQVKKKLVSILRGARKPYPFNRISAAGSKYFESLSKTTRRDIRKQLRRYEGLHFLTMHQNARQFSGNGISRSTGTNSRVPYAEILTDVELPGDNEHSPSGTVAEREILSALTSTTRPRTPAEFASNSPTTNPNLRLAEGPLGEKFREDIRRKGIEISNIRDQWQQEVEEFSQQLARSTQTEIELRAQIKHLEMARDARRLAGKDPLEDSLFQMTINIWSLTRKIQNMRELMSFTVQDPRQMLSDINCEIKNTMGLIISEMESILNGHDTKIPLNVPPIASNSDLGALVRSVYGNGVSTDLESTWLRRCLMRSDSLEMVVRALTAASLREWVLETSFPNFLPVPCPLLRATREAVMTQNGWKGLHNLDLVAHHKLIDSRHFQEKTIPYRAKELAARLSKALAGLFARSDNESENIDFETWGQDRVVWEDRRCRFTRIFEAMLRLKASTVMTDQQFEFVIYPPGTSHVGKAEGQVQTVQSDRPNIPAGDRGEDARPCWRHASIHCYPTEASYPQDQLADALVDSKNFTTRTAQERAELCTHTSYITVLKTESTNHTPQPAGKTPDQQMQESSIAEPPDVQKQSERVSSNTLSVFGNSNDENLQNDETISGMKSTAEAAEVQLLLRRCDICSRSFSRPADLTRHRDTNACPRCKECNAYFPSKEKVSEHRNEFHSPKPKISTSKRLLKLTRRSPPAGMADQPPANVSKATTSREKKSGITPTKAPLTFPCDMCDREFSSQRICNIHKTKGHKQRQELNSLEVDLELATKPAKSQSIPNLTQDKASLDDDANNERGLNDCTGSVPAINPTRLISEGQTSESDQQNRYGSPPRTPDGVRDRLTTSNRPSKRPRSVSPCKDARRIKTKTRYNDARRQPLEDAQKCEPTEVNDQVRGRDSAGFEPPVGSASSSRCSIEETQSPCLQGANTAKDNFLQETFSGDNEQSTAEPPSRSGYRDVLSGIISQFSS